MNKKPISWRALFIKRLRVLAFSFGTCFVAHRIYLDHNCLQSDLIALLLYEDKSALTMQSQVRYQKTTKIIFVPKIPEEAKNTIWYSDKDLTQIKHDASRTVRAVWRGKPLKTKTCDRGLEHLRSGAHMEQHRINKDCVITAVLKEQATQRVSGIIDTNKIAGASCRYSRWAKEKALILGASDAVYISSQP